jgi:hypothetical protein
MVYRIKNEELKDWVKNKANLGDVAYYYDNMLEQSYIYNYKGPDENPYWRLVFKDAVDKYLVDKYLEEINKLKIEEATVNKRCENCKYFKSVSVKDIAAGSWCDHEEHKGMYVPKFVSCPEYSPKEKRTTPFDGVKFYLIDDKTGELGLKYVCEDCGKVMDEPGHWWLALPLRDINGKQTRPFGYHFRCEECDKKKEGKV